jgi:penicillin-binding protein 1A
MAKKRTEKKKPTKDNAQNFSKYIRRFWILFTGGVFTFFFMFLLASWGLLGEMPDHTILENPKTFLATEIISSDNQTLGKFYLDDNRTPIDYEELPKELVDALVATEDIRYYDHSGIDFRGTMRAIYKMGRGGGASAIVYKTSVFKQVSTYYSKS